MPLEKMAHNVDMKRFNSALRRVVSVSKSDLQKLLAEEKMSKVGKPRPGPRPRSSASDHVSRDID
jgi:hypothetical protein